MEEGGAVDPLRERTKELAAMHAIARLLYEEFPSCDALFSAVVRHLPPAMVHADDCVARLSHGDIVVRAPEIDGTPVATLVASFETSNGKNGVIEIGYLHEHGAQVEGPFLAEERALVDSIAELVRVAIDRRILEGALLKAARQEAMSTLASSVAHDFNNLLGSIHANAAFLATELSSSKDPDIVSASQDIVAASERGAALASRLVSLNRKAPRSGFVTDVNATIEKLVPLLRPLLADDVHLVLDLGASLSVDIDPSELDRVVMNLVVNARDAMPNGGDVRVKTLGMQRGDRAFVRIAVADEGTGIERALLPRLFEPYFTTKPAGRGTGLGLAVVWAVVTEHGGHVAVTSEPGKGTTFHVDLPRCD